MKFKIIALSKAKYVGNCVNSFDENGDCIIGQLPWSTTSDFALMEEEANIVSKEEFLLNVEIPEGLQKLLKSKVDFLLLGDQVWTLYDQKKDIHYFFVTY